MDKSIQTIKPGLLAILTFLNIPRSLETAVISGGEPAADYSPLGEKCGEGLEHRLALRGPVLTYTSPEFHSYIQKHTHIFTHRNTHKHKHTSYTLGTCSTGLRCIEWTSSDVLQT